MANMSLKKNPMPSQEPDVRNKNFDEVALGYTEEMAIDEAKRCLNCKNPKCVNGCPVNVHIPEFIAKVAEGKFDEAFGVITSTNSLPAICGRVCPQENQCEGQCIRGIKGEPVGIGRLERFVADYHNAHGHQGGAPAVPESNGHKVAVVGSGPAGLTCAGDLARKGYDVTVFEALHQVGGVLVYGIPEFRLPKSILDRYKNQLTQMGIRIRPNTAIGRTLTVDDLQRDGYEAIFIGTGVWKPKAMGVPGESLGNVNYAIDYLVNPDVYDLGDDLVVIGAGNSAMDVARTALRKGVRRVSVFCRRYQTAASVREVDYAKADGVEFFYGMRPTRIVDNGVYYKKVEMDEEGNITSTSEEQFFPCSSVIIAISQGAQNCIVNTTTGLEMSSHGLLATNEHGETTREGIFASGDVVLGARTVVEAVKYSKQVADEMDAYLRRRREAKQEDNA